MKKSLKVISAALCLALSVGMLAGCSSSSSSSSDADAGAAAAEVWPDKPVTLIVPFGAGGGADVIARMMETLAPEYLGQSLVIVNKAGGGGSVAISEYLAEDADGYTLLFGSSAPFTSQPLMSELNYTIESFETITGLVSMGNLLGINPDLGITSLEELAAEYGDGQKELVFGVPAIGSVNHLVQAQLFNEMGITTTYVPFSSNSEVLAALLGGHIDIAALSTTELGELHKTGDTNVLCVFGSDRLLDPELADIPTAEEQGYDVTMTVWRMLLAQKGTPDEVLDVITEKFTAMLNDPAFVEFCSSQDLTIELLSEEEVIDKVNTEYAVTEEIYKELELGIFQ